MSRSFQFAREFLRDRKHIGSIVPSGTPLAGAMVKALGAVAPDQVIVELGPGTGVVTRRLENRWPDNRLVAVEFLEEFADRLAVEFPRAEVVRGCASELEKHLAGRSVENADIGGIVSSLPLLSLAPEMRDSIFEAVRTVLQPGRRYVQFTYNRKSWDRFLPEGFGLTRQRKVWRNLPPATVLTFVRQ